MLSMWNAISAIAAAATAIIAVFLLGQGQQDRRRLADERRRAQAAQVSLTTTIDSQRLGPTTTQLVGAHASVFNESDRLVHLTSLRLVDSSVGWESLRAAGRTEVRTEWVDIPDALLLPHSRAEFTMPSGWFPQVGVGGSFLLLEFTDAAGLGWRRRSDTFELQSRTTTLNAGQRFVQRLSRRLPPFEWLVVRLPFALARRAGRKRPDRVPASARWICALWGYWPPGSQDEWLQPRGAPPIWLYDDLVPPAKLDLDTPDRPDGPTDAPPPAT
jgi:hypothetical protein